MDTVSDGSEGIKDQGVLRALVVENDLASRELLARVLRRKGMEAYTAVGVAQAASLLVEASCVFDLLVVDLNIEPVDGVELLRHVCGLAPENRPGGLWRWRNPWRRFIRGWRSCGWRWRFFRSRFICRV
jgi:PleD family two-component response regulator